MWPNFNFISSNSFFFSTPWYLTISAFFFIILIYHIHNLTSESSNFISQNFDFISIYDLISQINNCISHNFDFFFLCICKVAYWQLEPLEEYSHSHYCWTAEKINQIILRQLTELNVKQLMTPVYQQKYYRRASKHLPRVWLLSACEFVEPIQKQMCW